VLIVDGDEYHIRAHYCSHFVTDVKKSTQAPVLIGSGVTSRNISSYMEADAVIVGTHFKENEV
jgi:predicted TIM-barrel enzyme